MTTFAYYLIAFGIPLGGYFLWRRYLRSKLGFLFLMPLLVAVTWAASWPIYSASIANAKDGDVVINGFVFMGWLPSVIGCVPVIVLDAIMSLYEWISKRRSHPVSQI